MYVILSVSCFLKPPGRAHFKQFMSVVNCCDILVSQLPVGSLLRFGRKEKRKALTDGFCKNEIIAERRAGALWSNLYVAKGLGVTQGG